MPAPSASAITQLSLMALFTRRYGSFAGKSAGGGFVPRLPLLGVG